MKTMSDYTIYCTSEQTKKALELGAPIEFASINDIRLGRYIEVESNNETYEIPTTEQMIGWLEEYIDNIDVLKNNNGKWVYLFYPTSNSSTCECKDKFLSRKEATLAAIDAALEYLENNEKIMSKNSTV